jgi:phosphonate transport system substrate-binding protein
MKSLDLLLRFVIRSWRLPVVAAIVRRRALLVRAGLFLPLLLREPVLAAEPSPKSEPMAFRIGMSSACFRNVNHNDALAAFRLFVEAVARQNNYVYKAETEIFDDASSFESALRRQPKNLVVIEAWQYLMMDLGPQFKPVFIVTERGAVGRQYLVLSRRDGHFRTLADLRQQRIVELRHSATGVGKAWLDNLLRGNGLGSQETLFAEVEMVEKPSAAVLPVFFGQRAACLVDKFCFEVMTELNPQVGQQLAALATSEAFADVVICLNENGWRSAREKADTIQSLSELHLHPSGRQILTLFKIEKMVPFAEEQLATCRKLRAQVEASTNAAAAAGDRPLEKTALPQSNL